MTATLESHPPTFSILTDRELVVIQDFDAPRALAWEAWSQPRHLAKWLLGPDGWTMPVCEIDLRPGGKWRFVWRDAEGNDMSMHGEYREVDPPNHLLSTEKWDGEWPETLNSLSLAEKDGVSTMTVRVRYPSNEARAAAMATGMTDGMAMSFQRLASYLRELQS